MPGPAEELQAQLGGEGHRREGHIDLLVGLERVLDVLGEEVLQVALRGRGNLAVGGNLGSIIASVSLFNQSKLEVLKTITQRRTKKT